MKIKEILTIDLSEDITNVIDMENIQEERIEGGHQIKIENGCVIVMHMQENAKYTAQVLDTMIPKWKEEGYSFARIDEYLGN